MFTKIPLFLVLSLSTLLSFGCGPEQPARDRAADDWKKGAEKDAQDLKLVVGRYRGEWRSPQGYVWVAYFELQEGTKKIPIPGDGGKPGKEIIVPALVGDGEMWLLNQDGVESKERNLGVVTSGVYDSETAKVSLGFGIGETTSYQFNGVLRNGDLIGVLTFGSAFMQMTLKRTDQGP